jgi:hypothetical protein
MRYPSLSRRRFLGTSLLAGASIWHPPLLARAATLPLNPRKLEQFLDALPRPARVSGARLDITATEFGQRLHSQLPPTRLWGYAGRYLPDDRGGSRMPCALPGETGCAAVCQSLPIDQTIHWADPLRTHHPIVTANHRPHCRRFSGFPLVTSARRRDRSCERRAPGRMGDRTVRAQGAGLGARVERLPQPSAERHTVVPRPRVGYHTPDRVRGVGGVLPAARS